MRCNLWPRAKQMEFTNVPVKSIDNKTFQSSHLSTKVYRMYYDAISTSCDESCFVHLIFSLKSIFSQLHIPSGIYKQKNPQYISIKWRRTGQTNDHKIYLELAFKFFFSIHCILWWEMSWLGNVKSGMTKAQSSISLSNGKQSYSLL